MLKPSRKSWRRSWPGVWLKESNRRFVHWPGKSPSCESLSSTIGTVPIGEDGTPRTTRRMARVNLSFLVLIRPPQLRTRSTISRYQPSNCPVCRTAIQFQDRVFKAGSLVSVRSVLCVAAIGRPDVMSPPGDRKVVLYEVPPHHRHLSFFSFPSAAGLATKIVFWMLLVWFHSLSSGRRQPRLAPANRCQAVACHCGLPFGAFPLRPPGRSVPPKRFWGSSASGE